MLHSWVGSCIYPQTSRLESPANDKISSLSKIINNLRTGKFHSIGSWCESLNRKILTDQLVFFSGQGWGEWIPWGRRLPSCPDPMGTKFSALPVNLQPVRRGQQYNKTFYGRNLKFKKKGLSVSSLVYILLARPGAYPRVEHLGRLLPYLQTKYHTGKSCKRQTLYYENS